MRRNAILNPRVTRKVLPVDELYTIDVETGKRIQKMVWCEYHKQYEWINDFYTESEARARHPYDVRNMCISAWDKVEGKVKPDKELSTASLFEFLRD
jgi:hypothetical protein